FGAAADTDLEVTEEMLGTELTVTEPGKGYNAFKIAAGQFTLNLNMENHTLVIKANSSKYDVNGDGEEDVRDVTALINYLLGAPNPNKVNLDINGDGDEDVRDLTALINYLLN
ncbi:MAG: hypothetical protein IK092_05300, partial [Muribaculaceae bacterium]|nr:hypothetical protein [Muribaculaceae bacterium]